jgi:hypothetical protein
MIRSLDANVTTMMDEDELEDGVVDPDLLDDEEEDDDAPVIPGEDDDDQDDEDLAKHGLHEEEEDAF